MADLGAAGSTAASGGSTEGVGGVIGATFRSMTARADAAAFFRGTNTGDAFTITNSTGGGGLTNVNFSGESGADSITFDVITGGSFSATNFVGGSGADVITADINSGTNFAVQTGGRIAFEGGAGNDTLVLNVQDGAGFSAGVFDGGDGADSITVNLLSGGSASVVNSGTELIGGSGADTIAFSVGAFATTAGAVVRAGSGADVISGTFGSQNGSAGVSFIGGEFSAVGGDGNDTIAFTFTAAATAGVNFQGIGLAGVGGGVSGGTFDGGACNDSISILAAAVTGGTFQFGYVKGGAGADTITVGGELGVSGGENAFFTGVIDGGAGADSIVFSGNNTYSGGVAVFVGGGAAGTGGFQFASGDSLVGGYDTIFVANEEVTGGNDVAREPSVLLASTSPDLMPLPSPWQLTSTITLLVVPQPWVRQSSVASVKVLVVLELVKSRVSA